MYTSLLRAIHTSRFNGPHVRPRQYLQRTPSAKNIPIRGSHGCVSTCQGTLHDDNRLRGCLWVASFCGAHSTQKMLTYTPVDFNRRAFDRPSHARRYTPDTHTQGTECTHQTHKHQTQTRTDTHTRNRVNTPETNTPDRHTNQTDTLIYNRVHTGHTCCLGNWGPIAKSTGRDSSPVAAALPSAITHTR